MIDAGSLAPCGPNEGETWMEMALAKVEQEVKDLLGRVERIEDRQDQLEKEVKEHREEFLETRFYTKETYKKLEQIQVTLNTIEKTTSERIEQATKYYRDELDRVQQNVHTQGSSNQTKILNFAKWVIGGILALATAIIAVLQIMAQAGGGQP